MSWFLYLSCSVINSVIEILIQMSDNLCLGDVAVSPHFVDKTSVSVHQFMK